MTLTGTYVVLEQVMVRDGVAEEPGWKVVGTYTAAAKTAAIRQHTGTGADVTEGTWKAVPVSSWKGGETTKRVTAAARLPLDEADS